jgi:hypothetical protein
MKFTINFLLNLLFISILQTFYCEKLLGVTLEVF